MLSPMATKTKPEPPTVVLSGGEAFAEWLRRRIGDQSNDAFAKSIGMTRQAVVGVLGARRAPGPKMVKALQRFGVKRGPLTYIVPAEPKDPC